MTTKEQEMSEFILDIALQVAQLDFLVHEAKAHPQSCKNILEEADRIEQSLKRTYDFLWAIFRGTRNMFGENDPRVRECYGYCRAMSEAKQAYWKIQEENQ